MDDLIQIPGSVNTSPLVAAVTREDGSVFVLPRFDWDANREQAAVDLAEGRYSLAAIADRAGTHTGTLSSWRRHPDFKERVENHRKVFREQVLSFGLSRQEVLLSELQERHGKLKEIIAARGEAFQKNERLAEVPGGYTGFVYEHPTANGVEYLIDNKAFATFNDIEKQAAVLNGNWNEAVGAPMTVQIVCPASAPDASKAPTITIGRT